MKFLCQGCGEPSQIDDMQLCELCSEEDVFQEYARHQFMLASGLLGIFLGQIPHVFMWIVNTFIL